MSSGIADTRREKKGVLIVKIDDEDIVYSLRMTTSIRAKQEVQTADGDSYSDNDEVVKDQIQSNHANTRFR